MLRVYFLLAAATLWADSRCVTCHQSIVDSYLRTGKSRSIGKPRAEVQFQRQWLHDFSGRRMGVVWQKSTMTHWMETKGAVEPYEVQWAIGSGKEVKNYIVRIGDSLFQSPLAWYANRLIWDMAPGFVIDTNPSFYRPLQSDCLQCHAGRVAPIAGTRNRYDDPPIPEPAIGCDRCHGDPAPHLALGQRGNIVNPANLPPNGRDAVCESCHLSGEARVLNPGKRFADYRPGMDMEEVFSIYVAKKNAADTILRAQSHGEELAASRCAVESKGKLWCGTCHDSHREPAEKERSAWYRDKCVQCHAGEPAETHRRKAGDDCVRCHMPRQRPYDGSHASRTDHWIRTKKSEEKFLDRGELLRAWREPAPNLRNRNLALAYLNNTERTRSLKRLREGLRLLNDAVGEGHKDGAVSLAAGLQYLRQKTPDLALPWLKRAVEDEPANSLRRLQYAAALASAGKNEDAKREALEAIKIEPLLEQAYILLAQIEPARETFWKERYRKAAPKRLPP
ncbi:MAG: tetratricopeptide repeat protein [Bryobacteraceae bacterium]